MVLPGENTGWRICARRRRPRRGRLKAEVPDRITTWSARSHCLDTVTGPRWVAVGDAASSWDPLSSAGILKALRTGKLGAFAVLDAIRGVEGGFAKYRRIISAEYARYQQDRRDVYRMEQRWRPIAILATPAPGRADRGTHCAAAIRRTVR
jgi:hypothetical protein